MALVLALVLLLPFGVTSGPYAGTYRVDPDGAVNWYFDTTAFLRLPRLPLPETRIYLDAYLAHLDPYGGIADVLPMNTGIDAPIAPDSEDAYAGTLLSLAARYRAESGDDAWWSAHVEQLSSVAYSKLLSKVKPDGLIRASGTDATGYLMDNVEDYAGLRAFDEALRTTHADRDEPYLRSFIAPLGASIHRMYDPGVRAFRWADTVPVGPLVPYPSCIAQVYPQLVGVASGDRRADLHRFAAARTTVAQCRFSFATDPHEAYLYALYLATLPDRTPTEAQFVRQARAVHDPAEDLVTYSLRTGLASAHPM